MRLLLGIIMFYGRFGLSFSNIGYAWRKAGWDASAKPLEGKHVVITGASGGIGAATAAGCLAAGARVTAVARNRDKLDKLSRALGEGLTTVQCDLAETKEVLTLSQTVRDVDVLVNNVGVMLHDFTLNSDGIDTQYATNLLNQFVLTEALMQNDGLKSDAHVIQVASGGMYMAPLVLEKLSATEAAQHDGTQAYAIQKRAQVVLTKYWNNAEHTETRKFHVMHPGWVDTAGVQQSLPTFRKLLKSILRDADAGADTIVWLAQQQPESDDTASIWFDRARRSVHAYGFTKSADKATDALAERLKEDWERVTAR